MRDVDFKDTYWVPHWVPCGELRFESLFFDSWTFFLKLPTVNHCIFFPLLCYHYSDSWIRPKINFPQIGQFSR